RNLGPKQPAIDGQVIALPGSLQSIDLVGFGREKSPTKRAKLDGYFGGYGDVDDNGDELK
ncbi:hypothetical protein L195_g042746, partial [Trifolium pratense]